MATGRTSIDRRIDEELRQLTEDTHPDGAALATAIDRFVDRRRDDGQSHYTGSGWNAYRALSIRMLSYAPATTQGHTRRRLMSLVRLSRWLGCSQDLQDLSFSLLSMSLTHEVKIDWAKALLEAIPGCGSRAVEDLVLCEHLGKPQAGQEDTWQWVLQRLIQTRLTPDKQVSYSFDLAKHTKTLLVVCYLWRASDKQWVGDGADRAQVAWMSQHRDSSTRKDEEAINTFLAEWRRVGLVAVADVRENDKAQDVVRPTRRWML